MYTKEELEKLPIPELMEIASELGIKVSQNDELESVVYAILDKAAENSAAGVSAPKRKRTRIAKDNSVLPSTRKHPVSGGSGPGGIDRTGESLGTPQPPSPEDPGCVFLLGVFLFLGSTLD